MPVKHGPNEFSEKDAEEYGKALQKLSPETIGKCEKFLLEGEKSLCAVVVGESGSGKSTFINALLGEDVAPVDGGRSSVPRKPSFYSGCVTNPSSNVSLTIVEVPEMKVDEMRAQQANFDRYCREGVDVVYVCQKMYDRQNSSAIETFRRLRTVFDGEIYKKAVIVLTFANDFPSNWGDERDEIALQQKIEKVWSDQASAIRGQLQRELQITREEAEKVLILPAGFYVEGDPINSRKIPGVTIATGLTTCCLLQ